MRIESNRSRSAGAGARWNPGDARIPHRRKRRDKKMVERVNDLDETIKSMKEEYGRKVSVDEVAERMGITEDTVEDILKLAGEEVKDE